MIEINSFLTEDLYFAARNGHGGFESHFHRVFAPVEYRRIFILKGGPGTGKSTLMRGLISFANEAGLPCEGILCSSDPRSLDGVIIKRGDARVAVIDGTAPHATDPKYPGAIEEIVDLGTGFDTRALEGQRDSIIALSQKKARSYACAYRALATAGGAFDCIWHELLNSDIYNTAEELSSELASEVDGVEKVPLAGEVLYSAFGKSGYSRLPIGSASKVFNIKGDFLLANLVGALLYERLRADGRVERIARNALDDRLIDRIYAGGVVFAVNEEREADIDLSCYSLPAPLLHAYGAYEVLLGHAADHFASASRSHFELEDIYSGCMDFSNNDRVFSSLREKIREYLR